MYVLKSREILRSAVFWGSTYAIRGFQQLTFAKRGFQQLSFPDVAFAPKYSCIMPDVAFAPTLVEIQRSSYAIRGFQQQTYPHVTLPHSTQAHAPHSSILSQ